MRQVAVVMMMLLMVLSAVPATAASGPSDPYVLEFTKSDPGATFVWDGVVTGDVDGDLTTRLTSARPAGQVLLVEFDWEITNAGDQSFVAHLSGVLNLQTGRVVMNGTVVDGWLEGAQVHEEGQLVDVATSTFAGTISVFPASA